MPTPFEIPAPILIEKLAKYLKDNVEGVVPPKWSPFIKTGSHVLRPPQNPQWWFVRCASILRKIYLKGPIGIQHLRSEYGGRVDRGVRPEHTRRSGGSIIRNAIKQLEAAGLVEPSRNRGRVVTGEGRRLLDSLSTEIRKNLLEKLPELKKY